MSGITLYEISEELVTLLDSYDMCETEDERAECAARIEAAVRTQVQKVDSFARFLAHLESQVELAAREIDRLKTRRQLVERKLAWLEQYAVRAMRALNVRRLEGETSVLTLRHNSPAVEVSDEEQIPAAFKVIRQTTTIDKRAIKQAIESGTGVAGAWLRPSISLIRR